jgi:hypothetical protein
VNIAIVGCGFVAAYYLATRQVGTVRLVYRRDGRRHGFPHAIPTLEEYFRHSVAYSASSATIVPLQLFQDDGASPVSGADRAIALNGRKSARHRITIGSTRIRSPRLVDCLQERAQNKKCRETVAQGLLIDLQKALWSSCEQGREHDLRL